MSEVTIFSPAKLNLFLTITGRRADGFHELVSVAAPLDWGDRLTVVETEAEDLLVCDDPAVPLDGSNLVLKAAAAFRAAVVRRLPERLWQGGARFLLEKRIPMGAGLGGGSSNAAAALRALNLLAGEPLSQSELAAVAAEIGSDCALFLRDGPVVMRGRGEQVETLGASGAKRLSGRRVLIFKPAFGISTAWAFGRMAAGAPESYLPTDQAEARLDAWLANSALPAENLLFNNMEPPAFAKFPAMPMLLESLRDEFRLQPRMSGSGSACFALLDADAPVSAIEARIRDAWGESAFVVLAGLR